VQKLQDLLLVLDAWTFKTSASQVKLQSLLSELLQVCKVVRSSHLQLSRMLGTLRRCLRQQSLVALAENFRLNLDWWHQNIAGWNCIIS
jgi:hypothetical protein